ncbi:MAG TPA: hypothetical protein VN426_17135 [Syntrophomonadaceae bacterium]|nr:hypothetical protein [Syntrophomonadaceae bacterium]
MKKMFSSGFMDAKDSAGRKLFHQDRIDPGTFSFMEGGWWALHAAAISGMLILGHSLAKNGRHRM